MMATTPWHASQYERLHAANDYTNKTFVREGDKYPAIFVSWNDAMTFCKMLTKVEHASGKLPKGWHYTLPTEAQWERACRAGSTTAFYFGNDKSNLADYAWFDKNTLFSNETYAHVVCQKTSNAWGLYDISGNVLEWCFDEIGDLPGGVDPKVERGPAPGLRVTRGGGWGYAALGCRAAYRHGCGQIIRGCDLGFRIAVVADE